MSQTEKTPTAAASGGRRFADKGLILPPAGTKRWGYRMKLAIVNALRGGVLTEEEACRRYDLTVAEIADWQLRCDRHGPRSLRVTYLRDYRV